MFNRFYKGVRSLEELDPINSYVLVDNSGFQAPHVISIENIGKAIQLKIHDDFSKRNVTSFEVSGQEENPTLPPDTFSVASRTQIAVDDNYLYVWIPKLARWKRLLLSEWNVETA